MARFGSAARITVRMSLPSANHRRAPALLMIATAGVLGPSPSVNDRPRSSDAPIAWKYPGVTLRTPISGFTLAGVVTPSTEKARRGPGPRIGNTDVTATAVTPGSARSDVSKDATRRETVAL